VYIASNRFDLRGEQQIGFLVLLMALRRWSPLVTHQCGRRRNKKESGRAP
jgi:hypothetical protein